MKKFALAAMLAATTLAAQAADPAAVGKLSNVEGLVSIGGTGFAANATNGAALMNGSTVTVSTRGKATVVLNDGCVVPLRGGQFLAINPKLTCSQLYSSVSQLFTPYRVAQAPVGGGGVGGAAAASGSSFVVAGGILAGIVVVGAVAENDDSSGN